MIIPTTYIFKNNDKISAVKTIHDNSPVAAVDKLKETFLQYGSKTFDSEEIARIFATVNEEANCQIIHTDSANTELVYYVENMQNKKKKMDLYVSIFKNNSKIFEGEMKKFVERAKKIEITFMPNTEMCDF